MKLFHSGHLGRLHIPHRKNTAGMSAVRMTPPEKVTIPMAMHIGAPAKPCVTVGAKVYVGTKIAEAGGFVSSPIHASVSGTVARIDTLLVGNGRSVPAIVITSDGLMEKDPSIAPPKVETLDDFIAAIRESGLVGLGGAGFPTAVKFEAEKKGQIDTVVVNGAECEPYITSDTRTMLDDVDSLVDGVAILDRFLPGKKIIFGVENNKPDCIAKLKEAFAGRENVAVAALPSTYPQGGEKILIYNTTGRTVPEGKLPADVGVIVLNVTSLAFIGKYFHTGMPLVEKCVTVDGSAIREPKNVICPIGTPVADVIAFAGGFSEEPGKILYGGPMMGTAIFSQSDPIVKSTNAITALNRKDAERQEPLACIHCGRCVSTCPMGLNPTLFAKAMNVEDPADRAARLEEAKINLCIECGCCSFACPSCRPLVDTNRLAKADLREYKAHQQQLQQATQGGNK